MSRSTLLFAILAISYLATSFAQSGLITINVIDDGENFFQEFEFDAVEFNNDVTNFNAQWSFEEEDFGEFELTNANGDIVEIRAVNFSPNTNLDEILGNVQPAVNLNTETTVASSIGNIISSIQGQVSTDPANSQTFTTTQDQNVAVVNLDTNSP